MFEEYRDFLSGIRKFFNLINATED